MRTVPREDLDIAYWHACGTLYCAGGWATKIPELARRGLALLENGRGCNIRYGCNGGFDAVGVAFGITADEVDFICWGNRYDKEWEDITPEDVVAQIEKIRIRYTPPLPAVKVTIKLEPIEQPEAVRESVGVTT